MTLCVYLVTEKMWENVSNKYKMCFLRYFQEHNQTSENIFRNIFWNATKHMKIFSFSENSISGKYLFSGNTFTRTKRSLNPPYFYPVSHILFYPSIHMIYWSKISEALTLTSLNIQVLQSLDVDSTFSLPTKIISSTKCVHRRT